MNRCIIVGAGEFDKDNWCCGEDDYVIAADAGWMTLEKLGITPKLLIGDMDSLREKGVEPKQQKEYEIELLPTHKDDTDMLAAIRRGLSLGYKQFHIYGGLGGRLDHTIANMQCLLFLHNRGAEGILYGRQCSVQLLCNGKITFPASAQGRVSVFAVGGIAHGVTERGLCYTVDKADLDPEFPIGVSNEFTGCESSIEVERGMLLIYTDKG